MLPGTTPDPMCFNMKSTKGKLERSSRGNSFYGSLEKSGLTIQPFCRSDQRFDSRSGTRPGVYRFWLAIRGFQASSWGARAVL